MLRLTLILRVAMIVLSALLAVWLVALGLVYRSAGSPWNELPEPERLAGFVMLLERLGPADRAELMRAVTETGFEPHLDQPGIPADALVTPADPVLVARYAAPLEGRLRAMVHFPGTPFGRRLPPAIADQAISATAFRVRLTTGEALVVISRRSAPVSRFGIPFGLAAGLFGTVLALLAFIALHREMRPVVRLAAAVDRVDLTGAPLPLPPVRGRSPEVRALISAFDRLQCRLDSLIRARLAMLGGISHDVRTFATRLRLRIDAIPDPVERDRASADITDMIALLDDALLASRAGAGELAEELVDLNALVAAEAEDRRALGADVRAGLAPGGELLVLGDRVALRRVIANLTDNALKYGTVARLMTVRAVDFVLVRVEDDGPGIPPEKRALMLEPFTRLETSRSRDTGGAGLGLAVIRTLTEAHGGSVEIDAAPGGGARVTIRLPAFVG